MSPESVVLEVCFVSTDGDDQIAEEDFWDQVDEQQLASDIRPRLASNGFRAGLVGLQLPIPLRRQLDSLEDQAASGGEDTVVVESEFVPCFRRIQCRAGKRSEIIASPAREKLVVLLEKDGKVDGRTFHAGQCLIAVKSFPQPDGRVHVELVPEVHYGQPRSVWIGQNGVFRLDTSRQRRIFDWLHFDATMSPGETLILAGTSEARGVGKHFFTRQSADGTLQRNVLLIRLAQTQRDELFGTE